MDSKQRRKIFWYVGGIVVLAWLVGVAYFFSDDTVAKDRTYATGTLVYNDFSVCGLVRTRSSDWMNCRISGESCSEFRDYVNKRIRIAGVRTVCESTSDLQCSYGKIDFSQPGFEVTDCFTNLKLIKTF